MDNTFNGYDPARQLRPRISAGDFFRSSGSDFCWFVLEPITKARGEEPEPAFAERLSSGQKALYFWWYLDAQVTNGGFVQFYFNGYGIYVPAIIAGLEHVGDGEMAALVRKAELIYSTHRAVMEEAREKDEFGSELYEHLSDMEACDDAYYVINDHTMAIIERYAKAHPDEFCVDEIGRSLVGAGDRTIRKKFKNGKLKEQYVLKNGLIDGELLTYHVSGSPASSGTYDQGRPLGEHKEWAENGSLRKVTAYLDALGTRRLDEYDEETGGIKSSSMQDQHGKRSGTCVEYHPNGAMKERSTFISNTERIGLWEKWWDNGTPQLKAEFKNGAMLLHGCWDRDGAQLLKDGTGLHVNEFEMDSFDEVDRYRYESSYKDHVRHGTSRSFLNGVLQLTEEYHEGLAHGPTRHFDDEGNVTEEKFFSHGQELQPG
ncbi:MAG: DMP19 family protein [Flavobacteriales bacterium]